MSPPEIEEISDDDDEAEMSMDELSGVGQCVADKMVSTQTFFVREE